jgi:hypothetical protein
LYDPLVPLDLLTMLAACKFCTVQPQRKGCWTNNEENPLQHCSWWHGTASPPGGAPAVPCITCYRLLLLRISKSLSNCKLVQILAFVLIFAFVLQQRKESLVSKSSTINLLYLHCFKTMIIFSFFNFSPSIVFSKWSRWISTLWAVTSSNLQTTFHLHTWLIYKPLSYMILYLASQSSKKIQPLRLGCVSIISFFTMAFFYHIKVSNSSCLNSCLL